MDFNISSLPPFSFWPVAKEKTQRWHTEAWEKICQFFSPERAEAKRLANRIYFLNHSFPFRRALLYEMIDEAQRFYPIEIDEFYEDAGRRALKDSSLLVQYWVNTLWFLPSSSYYSLGKEAILSEYNQSMFSVLEKFYQKRLHALNGVKEPFPFPGTLEVCFWATQAINGGIFAYLYQRWQKMGAPIPEWILSLQKSICSATPATLPTLPTPAPIAAQYNYWIPIAFAVGAIAALSFRAYLCKKPREGSESPIKAEPEVGKASAPNPEALAYKEKISQLQKELEEASSQLEKHKVIFDQRLQEELGVRKKIEGALAETRQALDNAQNQQKEQFAQIAKLQAALSEKEEAHRQKVQELSSQISNLTQQSSSLLQKISLKHEALTKVLEELKTRTGELQAARVKILEQLDTLNTQNQKIESQQKALTSVQEIYEMQISTLQQTMRQKEAALREKIKAEKAQTEQVAKLQSTLAEKERAHGELEAERASQIRQLTQQSASLQQKASQAEEELRKTLQELRSQGEELQAAKAKILDQQVALSAQNGKITEQQKALSSELKRSETQMAALQQNVDQKEEALLEAKRVHQTQVVQIAKLQETLAEKDSAHKQEMEKLSSQIKKLTEESSLLQKNATLREQEAILQQKETSTVYEMNDHLRRELEVLRRRVVQLEADIADQKRMYNLVAREHETMIAKLDQPKSQLQPQRVLTKEEEAQKKKEEEQLRLQEIRRLEFLRQQQLERLEKEQAEMRLKEQQAKVLATRKSFPPISPRGSTETSLLEQLSKALDCGKKSDEKTEEKKEEATKEPLTIPTTILSRFYLLELLGSPNISLSLDFSAYEESANAFFRTGALARFSSQMKVAGALVDHSDLQTRVSSSFISTYLNEIQRIVDRDLHLATGNYNKSSQQIYNDQTPFQNWLSSFGAILTGNSEGSRQAIRYFEGFTNPQTSTVDKRKLLLQILSNNELNECFLKYCRALTTLDFCLKALEKTKAVHDRIKDQLMEAAGSNNVERERIGNQYTNIQKAFIRNAAFFTNIKESIANRKRALSLAFQELGEIRFS